MTRRGGGAPRQFDWGRAVRAASRQTVPGGIRLERQDSEKLFLRPVGRAMTPPPPILVEDDDDDVCISSPRSFAQAISSVSTSRQRGRAVEHHGLNEDHLTLRLGPTDYVQSQSVRISAPIPQNTPKPPNPFIDLTTYDSDCILVDKFVQKKRKVTQVASNPSPPEPVKEPKLTCAICMDTMKEETSTICGHIFCRKCIHNAIQAQKKCPTCRQSLNQKQTHRIYLSASLRNA